MIESTHIKETELSDGSKVYGVTIHNDCTNEALATIEMNSYKAAADLCMLIDTNAVAIGSIILDVNTSSVGKKGTGSIS